MRQAESDYWDEVARKRLVEGKISDNWLKRQAMMAIMCKYAWFKHKVLEIGIGAGTSAALLKLVCGGLWSYVGTDISKEFCDAATNQWGLKTVHTDILDLPDGKFTRVLALDSLEHVRHEDRPQGYSNIVECMEKEGLLFINIPLNESSHDMEFDHGFGIDDLSALVKLGLALEKYETYSCYFKSSNRKYALAVLSK